MFGTRDFWFKMNKLVDGACLIIKTMRWITFRMASFYSVVSYFSIYPRVWNFAFLWIQLFVQFAFILTTEMFNSNPKMKAFDVIKVQFRVLAIRPLSRDQPQNVDFNWKFLSILFLIALHIVMVIVFLAFEAANYDEISASVFIILTSLVGIVFYLSFEYQTNSVYKLIGDLDQFVSKRKTFVKFAIFQISKHK